MKRPKLKPCPFCGSTKQRREKWAEGFDMSLRWFFAEIKCRCGARVRGEWTGQNMRFDEGCAKSISIAENVWNHRKEGGAE